MTTTNKIIVTVASILALTGIGSFLLWRAKNKKDIADGKPPKSFIDTIKNPIKNIIKPTTNFCETLGKPLENYVDKFSWYKSALPIDRYNFPKNCRNWIIKDIIDTPTFEVGNGFKNNLNGGIIISNNYDGTSPVRGYYVGGNVGGIKCRVLITMDYLGVAYYDYDTCELKGYNAGIYYTKDFSKYKCKNIPFAFIEGTQNDPAKMTIMDRQNPLMLPYLIKAASEYNAFITGKDWNGGYDLSGTDFMKPTNAIESAVAQEALASYTANSMVDYFLSNPQTYTATIINGTMYIRESTASDYCPNGDKKDYFERCSELS